MRRSATGAAGSTRGDAGAERARGERSCAVRACRCSGSGTVATALTAALAACSGPQHALSPGGPAASRIADLWWVMFGLAAAVSVVVIAALLFAVHRSRQRQRGRNIREVNGLQLVVGGGVIVPAIVIFSVLLYSYRVGTVIYPPPAVDGGPFTIEVIGRQFWWEIHYPDHGITTANEVHIPVGRPVRFMVSAPDVIHSFWVPRLHGKIDMIPGRVNTIWLQADEPGAFRGQCAEYCGMGHALMAFWVVALPDADFDAWLERAGRPVVEPAEEEVRRGRDVFIAAGCDQCHSTRGSPLPSGRGAVGPDLADLANRRTLAAGTLPNTREALAAWITDPQPIKPGSHMPGTRLGDAEMQALLTYLQSLRQE